MFNRASRVGVALSVCACSGAWAQETIVLLTWTSGQSAGTRAQNYPPAQDTLDIWAVEDFRVDRDWFLDRFSCSGSGTSGGVPGAATLDVEVQIWDGLPPNGGVVLASTPGAGRCVEGAGGLQWDRFTAPFAGQRLRAGSYWVAWRADLAPSLAPAVMFSQAGEYEVGAGDANSSWRFWPNQGGRLELIRSNLDGTGDPIGTNFTLTGEPACAADINDDRAVDIEDVLAYLALFEDGAGRADLDDGSGTGRRDGGVDVEDLLFFLARLGEGC